MRFSCYDHGMEDSMQNVHDDILKVLYDWKQICQNHHLLDRSDFLNKMHNHILLLDDHLAKLNENNPIYKLLIHVLHTPGGAPIVTKDSLSDCAKDYSAEHSSKSTFYQYLKKSLISSNEHENFLFVSLSILDEKLQSSF